jgi:hypothetical protein
MSLVLRMPQTFRILQGIRSRMRQKAVVFVRIALRPFNVLSATYIFKWRVLKSLYNKPRCKSVERRSIGGGCIEQKPAIGAAQIGLDSQRGT